MNKVDTSNKTMAITWFAVLIAMQMILSKLSIGPSFLKIGFGFVATALIGYYFGPFKGAVAGLFSDIISNVVFPPEGGFFFGFTISAIVAGFLYGLILYRKKVTIWRALLATVLVIIIVDLLMNTMWVSMLASVPFKVMFTARIIKEIIFIPIQTIVLYVVFRWIVQHNYN